MVMTNEEIIREYREAKSPTKQIGILADQNQCSRKDILAILQEAGCEVPGWYRGKKSAGEETEEAVSEGTDAGAAALRAGLRDAALTLLREELGNLESGNYYWYAAGILDLVEAGL